jgi:hypothetical protein
MSSTPVQRDRFEVSPKGITPQTDRSDLHSPSRRPLFGETCCRMAKIIAPMRCRW